MSLGEDLILEGEPNDSMYVVLRGRVHIIVRGRQVDTLGVGAFIGEQSLSSRKLAGATVRTASFCELYRLRREAFIELQFNFPATFNSFHQARGFINNGPLHLSQRGHFSSRSSE